MFSAKTKPCLRGLVGITIAHVLAFQLILTAALATQMAFVPDGDQAICHNVSTGGTNNDTHPAQPVNDHETCGICVFAACSSVVVAQQQMLVVWPSRAITLRANCWTDNTPQRRHEPRSSQGPPPIV
ncbi:hypothetical protein Q3C01_05435 [Bradyrhizobium sp. UFLA05-109]